LFLLNDTDSEEENMLMSLKTLFEDSPRLAEFHEKYMALIQDKELYEAYEARMKWWRDYNSGIYAAWEEGYKEGIEESRKKNNQAIIQSQITKRFGGTSDS
jgi:flagellar biosynthesis/type III secretory pathway protein FliH